MKSAIGGGRRQGIRDIVRTARLQHDRAFAQRALQGKTSLELAALDGLHRILGREIRGAAGRRGRISRSPTSGQ